MDEVERFPIAPNLFLGAVMKQRFAKDDGADALIIDLDTFDAVGRNGTLNQGMLFKGF